MIHLHLNIYNAHGDALDEDGADFVDMDMARRWARDGIRSMLSAEVLAGELNLKGRCDIVDDNGAVLETMPFSHTLSIIGPDGG